jgi:hypothetical protein
MTRNVINMRGLAMGAPTSVILSEIYLQYIEHTYVEFYKNITPIAISNMWMIYYMTPQKQT